MESFIDKLRRRATGIFPSEGTAGDMSGETAMDINYDPNQTFTSPYFGQENRNSNSGLKEFQSVPYRIDPRTGKKVAADGSNATMQGTNQSGMPKMNAPDAVTNYTQQGQQKFGLGEKQFQNIFGISYSQAGESWKDKGGFEGLMSNPAFTLGLGLMKSSATGQPMSQSLFDNALKAGAISGEYAERIKKRSEVLAPVTEGQRDEVAAVLAEDNFYEPNILDKLKKGNQSAKYREALDDVYDRADKLAKAEAKKSGKSVRFGRKHIRAALKQMENKGEIKRRDPAFFGIIGGTIESTKGIGKRAKGGPVTENKPYIVGEQGAEMFVPQVDGNIIDNDDTKVVNMLLESNPQLKNVSRARAVKILKNRFPDYF